MRLGHLVIHTRCLLCLYQRREGGHIHRRLFHVCTLRSRVRAASDVIFQLVDSVKLCETKVLR